MFVGQVLANFYIKYYEKDVRKVGKGYKVELDKDHITLCDQYRFSS